jgi:hypothetical protein
MITFHYRDVFAAFSLDLSRKRVEILCSRLHRIVVYVFLSDIRHVHCSTARMRKPFDRTYLYLGFHSGQVAGSSGRAV